MNTALSYNQLQQNLALTCHQVCNEHTPVLIEMDNGNRVVLVSQEDYLSLIAKTLSQEALTKIWDNDDDAVYDQL